VQLLLHVLVGVLITQRVEGTIDRGQIDLGMRVEMASQRSRSLAASLEQADNAAAGLLLSGDLLLHEAGAPFQSDRNV